MVIQSNFIHDIVVNFRNALPTPPQLCEAKDDAYSMEDYANEEWQKVYALRLLPAYYFEYCDLAADLNRRAAGDCKSLNVASFGCGLCQDYHALSHNLTVPFSYTGYDAVDWAARAYMPKTKNNFRFINRGVEGLTTSDVQAMDVFFFPKSLTDIADNS
ncbi:MAG: hypothetical protein HQL35_05690, partial [Alphaproteobacteria bacterium]|nr:hypothetical protein [Alphaproteobacteria bacterium]